MIRVVTLAVFTAALMAMSAEARILTFPPGIPSTGPKDPRICMPFPDPTTESKPDPRTQTRSGLYCAPPL